MSNENSSQSPHQERLNRIVAEYLDAVETGRATDREKVLAQNPELARELEQFFADHDRMRALAQPIRPADTPATTNTGQAGKYFPGTTP